MSCSFTVGAQSLPENSRKTNRLRAASLVPTAETDTASSSVGSNEEERLIVPVGRRTSSVCVAMAIGVELTLSAR